MLQINEEDEDQLDVHKSAPLSLLTQMLLYQKKRQWLREKNR